MNHSNRYNIEAMARQRQAEIEKQLRLAAELRTARAVRPNTPRKYRWIAVAATALSVLGTVASIVVAHAR